MRAFDGFLLLCLSCILLTSLMVMANSDEKIHISHGLSRFDEFKYSEDFTHFDYVNPDAPKGGAISLYAHGSFDNLNPYAVTGMSPALIPSFNYLRYGFSELNEPLMVGSGLYSPSGDEIKTAYGLIAASVEYPEDNRWIIFNLRPEARFHDGKSVTANDVAFSFKRLRESAHPRFIMQLESVKDVEILNNHRVRFNFKQKGNRTQLFRAAELPVLPKHFWEGKEIGKTSLVPVLNSGPYKVTDVRPGVSVTFSRVKDYWGRDLPVNKGRYNFDKVTLYFYRSIDSAFEAFKAGGHDLHLEVSAKNWHQSYDFPAIREGAVKRVELPHQMSVGSTFFFFNTRRAPFDNIKVRQAITLMFDFEWSNKALFFDSYKRANSFFPNTYLAASKPPSEAEKQLLSPWRSSLPDSLFIQPFQASITSGDGILREERQRAVQLLKEAGWHLQAGVMRNDSTGEKFEFTFVDDRSNSHRYILPFKKNLATIGIHMHYLELNAPEYYQRVRALDFDMVEYLIPQTQAPDFELERFFHSETVDMNGTMNLAGVNHPLVDALLERVPQTTTKQAMETVLHSLDRVLMWGYYGIPKWHSIRMRVSFRDIFQWPENAPAFSTPFSTWWSRSAGSAENSR